MNTASMIPVFVMAVLLISAATATIAEQAGSSAEVTPRSDIQFQPLNPDRGDASPRAGVLWGDITTDVPSGALIEFIDGFSSPPHIHNITYRAVVISGAVHNDDPDAEHMWMGPGSFWMQPAGESHITAAAPGGKATAFLEILEGPYLVEPASEAFDNGQKPINLEQRNVIWLDSSDITWLDLPALSNAADGPKLAFLWGKPQDNQKNGTLLKLPAAFKGELTGNGATLRAVIIQGQISHRIPGESEAIQLKPGSYFGAMNRTPHQIACDSEEACTLYISTKGKYRLDPS